jgi:hypothetical protein
MDNLKVQASLIDAKETIFDTRGYAQGLGLKKSGRNPNNYYDFSR